MDWSDDEAMVPAPEGNPEPRKLKRLQRRHLSDSEPADLDSVAPVDQQLDPSSSPTSDRKAGDLDTGARSAPNPEDDPAEADVASDQQDSGPARSRMSGMS